MKKNMRTRKNISRFRKTKSKFSRNLQRAGNKNLSNNDKQINPMPKKLNWFKSKTNHSNVTIKKSPKLSWYKRILKYLFNAYNIDATEKAVDNASRGLSHHKPTEKIIQILNKDGVSDSRINKFIVSVSNVSTSSKAIKNGSNRLPNNFFNKDDLEYITRGF